MRSHRSGSGMGTSSGSPNASGSTGDSVAEGSARGSGALPEAGPAAKARPRATTMRFRLKIFKLVLVSFGSLDATDRPPARQLQREGEIPDQRTGRAHRDRGALAVGVRIGHQGPRPRERLEVRPQEPVGGVVEAHHVERRPDSTVL